MNSLEIEDLIKKLTSEYEHQEALQKLKEKGWSPSTLKEKAYYLFASSRLSEIFDGEDQSEQILAEIVNDKTESAVLRMNAAKILGEAKTSSALESLISSIDSEDIGVRNHVVIALGLIGKAKAVDPLIDALKHGRDDDGMGGIRSFAATALARIGGEKAINALKESLEREFTYIMQSKCKLGIVALEVEKHIKRLRSISSYDIEKLKENSISNVEFSTRHDVKMRLLETFEYYTRSPVSDFGTYEVKIEIDNYVEKNGQVAPATKQLEILIVKYEKKYVRYDY